MFGLCLFILVIVVYIVGADLMKVTDEQNKEKMVVIEINSCPSGSKYMPFDKINLSENILRKQYWLCKSTVFYCLANNLPCIIRFCEKVIP